jgi:hypothetical protein
MPIGDKPYTNVIIPRPFDYQPDAPFTAVGFDAAMRAAYFASQWDAISVSSQVYQEDFQELDSAYYEDGQGSTPATSTQWVEVHQGAWDLIDDFTHLRAIFVFGVYMPYTEIHMRLRMWAQNDPTLEDFGTISIFNTADLQSPDAYIGLNHVLEHAHRIRNIGTLNQMAVYVTTCEIQRDRVKGVTSAEFVLEVQSKKLNPSGNYFAARFRPSFVDVLAELRF